MGKSSPNKSAQPGQFSGIGLKKAARRKNAPGGSARLYYPYVRKEQKGTLAESLIHKNFSDLTDQYNSLQTHINPLNMEQSESAHQLAKTWFGTNSSMQDGKSVKSYQKKHGGSRRSALSKLIGLGVVSFGADPKSK